MFDSMASTEHDSNKSEDSFHVGKVVFNNDPARQQRVKVTVPGYFEDSNPDNLPWVGPVAQSDFGMTATHGSVKVPVLGSLILVKFQGGDKNKGLYEGYLVTAGNGAAMPAELSTNYPHRYGYWDPKGNKAFTDMQTGQSKFIHNSGTTVTFEADGMINIVGNVTIVGALVATSVTTAAGIDLAGHHHIGVHGPTSAAVA